MRLWVFGVFLCGVGVCLSCYLMRVYVCAYACVCVGVHILIVLRFIGVICVAYCFDGYYCL